MAVPDLDQQKDIQMTEYDLDAFVQPLKLGPEPNFPPEELVQPVYDREIDVEYKPAHMWSLRDSLAIFLDKGLTGMMAFEYGYPLEGIKRARDLFRKYAEDSDGHEFEIVGSDDYEELMWALDWLKDNFTGLWT